MNRHKRAQCQSYVRSELRCCREFSSARCKNHHDGFCILPTKTRGNSVAQTSHKTDIVRAYVDSFRRAGLRVGLYYSILSLRDDIRHFNVTREKIELIKDQLTELFSAYGEVDILITDGWDAP